MAEIMTRKKRELLNISFHNLYLEDSQKIVDAAFSGKWDKKTARKAIIEAMANAAQKAYLDSAEIAFSNSLI